MRSNHVEIGSHAAFRSEDREGSTDNRCGGLSVSLWLQFPVRRLEGSRLLRSAELPLVLAEQSACRTLQEWAFA